MNLQIGIILVVIIALLGLGGTALYYKSEMTQAKADLTVANTALAAATAANVVQQQAIADLQATRLLDGGVLIDLGKNTDALTLKASDLNDEIVKLERSNNEVRNYMSSPIPADLLRLLTADTTSTDKNSKR